MEQERSFGNLEHSSYICKPTACAGYRLAACSSYLSELLGALPDLRNRQLAVMIREAS